MMEKKLTNSGPCMESTGKHSIYTPLREIVDFIYFVRKRTLQLHAFAEEIDRDC